MIDTSFSKMHVPFPSNMTILLGAELLEMMITCDRLPLSSNAEVIVVYYIEREDL